MDRIAFRLDPELRRKLEQMAAARRRKLSDFLRVVLEDVVKQEEAQPVQK